MDLNLEGKNVLVCAASRGLGYAVARAFAQEGARLAICSRNPDAIGQAARNLVQEHGASVMPHAVDLSDAGNLPPFIEWLDREFGHVDVLVNNIGGPSPSSAQETELTAWRRGFEQLFLSSSGLTQHLARGMKQRGFGRVLTITSLSVMEPIENLAVSTTMRAAVTAFNKTLSQELAPFGVTVNTLMPGVIHTQRIEDLRQAKAERLGTSLSEEMRRTNEAIPMGRMGRPEELADLAVFLASERASYITGANIPVDGGLKKGIW